MIKAVIFDLDGLLIDSTPIWRDTFIQLSKIHNVPFSESIYKLIMGMGLKEGIILIIQKLKLKEDPRKILAETKEIFYKILFENGNLKLLEGAGELLEKIKNEKIIIGLATGGHSEEMINKILKKIKIYEFFNVVVSSYNVEKGKPFPDVYFLAAEKLKVKPEECLVIEDTVNGTLAGKAAKMRVYGVNKDEIIKKDLLKAGADKVFSSLLQIDL